ncbi:GGDEF domain-containing protein [Acidovorax sp.]|uniref:GGDEF domain-containing protein n=1 Tax=Acidovorax sp. TaxID=1872122 RepID=UPI000AB96F1F|nr:GGDEF domain-containing protein [Acidovorax sp.]
MHSPTLLITAAIFCALVTSVLYTMWAFNRNVPGLKLWALSFFAASTFAVNLLLRDVLPEVVAVALAQVSVGATSCLCWLGGRAYMGRHPLHPYQRACVVLAFVALFVLSVYFSAVDPRPGLRFALVSSFAGVFFLLTAQTVAQGRVRQFPARYLFAAIVGAHGLFVLLRPLMFKLAQPGNMADPDADLLVMLSQFVVLESTIAVVMIGFGTLMLTNEFITTALRRLAETDPLTQVFNRRSFLTLLDKAMSSAQRTGAPLPVLVLDLDHFKAVNDTRGHRGGDEVLRHFVQVALRCLRKEDVIGRLGGEEFGVFLPNSDAAGAVAVAERLRAMLAASPAYAETAQPLRMTVSIGVALASGSEASDAVLQRADEAMYLAKQRGRNRVEILPPAAVPAA